MTQPVTWRRYAVLAALLVLVLLWGLRSGSLPIGWSDLANSLWGGAETSANQPLYRTVVWDIRLPRLLMAALIGAGLAISGACLQALFRNPLAEPTILGITSGATAFALGTMILAPGFFLLLTSLLGVATLPLLASLGAASTLALMLVLARQHSFDPNRVILIGIAINVFAGAIISVCAYVASDQQLRILSFWGLGSLAAATWNKIPLLLVAIGLGTAIIVAHARFLNALLLGESEAHHLGFSVKRAKQWCLLGVTLISGSAVAFTGMIGFVGLVMPHIMRLLFGPNHRHLLWYSAMAGAGLLVFADTLARTLIAPIEMPVGIITALIGGPFFVILLMYSRLWHPNT
ncbi:FecCD family ABC transporter permease [Salinispirillum marinum]|uniref:FecCD family ABC transporter permease n=2 Tax=Saccharospirillaceae TaxID=255527 RepID=A0ABV8BCL7_9GAMM